MALQCEQNRVFSLYQRFFGFLNETGIYVISANMDVAKSSEDVLREQNA